MQFRPESLSSVGRRFEVIALAVQETGIMVYCVMRPEEGGLALAK
jgi:hypothetical protein